MQPRCTDNPAELRHQDFVIICLKAHSISGVIEAMQPLLGPRTRIVTAVNGIPYWYFHKHGGRYEGSTLESIDPGGRVYGDRFSIGEPSGEITHDVRQLSALFTEAGMQAPMLDRIHDEIWLKLWGNVCLNPISALTRATLDVICSGPATRALSKAIMLESQAIAEKLGVKFRVDVERRIEGARKVGGAQDLDAAGSGARTPDGDRPAGRGGPGNGPSDANPDACARHRAGTRRTARANGRAMRH